MELAGIRVRDALVLELALLLRRAGFSATAERLEGAVAAFDRIVGLSIEDREAILAVLADGPSGLQELRTVLLQEHAWRTAEGIS